MRFACCDARRLEVIEHAGSANAIEFLEVLDHAAPPGAPRQCTLFVRLLRPGFTLQPGNVRITGGERIRTVGVLWCASADDLPAEAEAGLVDGVDDLARTLVVRTDGAGDFSRYTLALVVDANHDSPPDGFDPRLSSIEFSFKVECPTDFDCAATDECPPVRRSHPEIDYLAKDYQGFRRLMLDRLSLLVPDWTERSAADLGMVLVELLAYAADNLSYRQDAVANEAYLDTARRRVSVRRHARLVDYTLSEGCNARAFVHFELEEGVEGVSLPKGSQLLTHMPASSVQIVEADLDTRTAIAADAAARGALVFETAHDASLAHEQNSMLFYTWGDRGCCLPRGATKATLQGQIPSLAIGSVLIFEEKYSPTRLNEADRDTTHRWAVRLTKVPILTEDPSGGLFKSPPTNAALPITEIEWSAADALPFPLCISVAEEPDLDISVALGNIVLADHGLAVTSEVGPVPEGALKTARGGASGPCSRPDLESIPARFRPALDRGPLTFGFDLEAFWSAGLHAADVDAFWPASALIEVDVRRAGPRLVLHEHVGDEDWFPRPDLLGSDGDAREFVVEVEDDARAHVRFGDARHGKRPDPGTNFTARYRVGNGSRGNVGSEAIAHVITETDLGIQVVRNPLAASGGVDPEDIEVARRDAPHAFRTQERAVTPADYAAAAERRREVQRAAASFRWTGSWYTVFVTADRFGGADVDAPFRARMRQHLERFRMAGYDLDFDRPRYVPLDIALHVCVKPGYFDGDVVAAVKHVLSSAVLADGSLGLFHPDNFSFGDPVYLSRIIAAAQAVAGVASVRVDRFQRLQNPSPTSLAEGVISLGALEIAMLANNPNFPEQGKLTFSAGGGA